DGIRYRNVTGVQTCALPIYLLERAPPLFEPHLGIIIQSLCFRLKPVVNTFLVGNLLVDIPGLVAQIEDHLIIHRLVEFVGMDIEIGRASCRGGGGVWWVA